jgi:hypothetical protein
MLLKTVNSCDDETCGHTDMKSLITMYEEHTKNHSDNVH